MLPNNQPRYFFIVLCLCTKKKNTWYQSIIHIWTTIPTDKLSSFIYGKEIHMPKFYSHSINPIG